MLCSLFSFGAEAFNLGCVLVSGLSLGLLFYLFSSIIFTELPKKKRTMYIMVFASYDYKIK